MAKVTQTEFGAWTGLTQPEVSKYVKANVIDLSEGLQASVVRYCKHARKTASGRQGVSGEHDLTDERARLAHHQANNEALKERVNKGELLKMHDVINHWAEMISNARSKLLMIPSRMAPKVLRTKTVKDVEKMLKAEIVNALEELTEAQK